MTCELRFNGESYGWEAMFRRDGELHQSWWFATQTRAIQWAYDEHAAQYSYGQWTNRVTA